MSDDEHSKSVPRDESPHDSEQSGRDSRSKSRGRSRDRSDSRDRKSRSRSRSRSRSPKRRRSRSRNRRRSRSRSRSGSPYRRRTGGYRGGYGRGGRGYGGGGGGRRYGGGGGGGRFRREDRRDRYRSRSPESTRRRHLGDREAPTESKVLGIFNLSLGSREETLHDVFGRYGHIEEVTIVYDRKTGRSRGFGFVTFEDQEDAREARDAVTGMEIDGRAVRVDYSITQRAHTPTPGMYMGRPTR